MMKREDIPEKVHEYYWKDDINCARTTLCCLSQMYDFPIETQTIQAAIGLHGAGGYRAQCGLVEGALMFIGSYYSAKGKEEAEIVDLCYRYAEAFEKHFGSLRCYDLRPSGFTENDPPHMCEKITCEAVTFAYDFIKKLQ